MMNNVEMRIDSMFKEIERIESEKMELICSTENLSEAQEEHLSDVINELNYKENSLWDKITKEDFWEN